jgi:hypothetical protein
VSNLHYGSKVANYNFVVKTCSTFTLKFFTAKTSSLLLWAYDFIRPHLFNIICWSGLKRLIITFILLFYHSRSTIVVSLKNSLNLKGPYIILLLLALIVSHLISINVCYTTKACLVGLQNFFLQVSYYGIELILSLDLGEIFTIVPQEMSKLYIFFNTL